MVVGYMSRLLFSNHPVVKQLFSPRGNFFPHFGQFEVVTTGAATGIHWVEDGMLLKTLQGPRQPPQQGTVHLKMSSVKAEKACSKTQVVLKEVNLIF